MIDRIPLLPPEIPNPEITGYKYGTHVTFMDHEKNCPSNYIPRHPIASF